MNGRENKITSEEVTRKRHAERQRVKWERARKEIEVTDQRIMQEREAAIIVEDNVVDGLITSKLPKQISLLGQLDAEETPCTEPPVAKVFERTSQIPLNGAAQSVSINKCISILQLALWSFYLFLIPYSISRFLGLQPA